MKCKTYTCPLCGGEMTTKDINVAKDIMLCPKCGEVSSFSEVLGRLETANHEDDVRRLLSAPPPKHLKIETDPSDFSGRVVCTYRKLSLLCLFFVPFTALWAGGSMGGIYGSQILRHEFNPQLSLFGIPFLIGSIVLVSLCLFFLFGKRVLTLERGKGTFFCGVGFLGFRRRFAYNRNSTIEIGASGVTVGGSRGSGGTPLMELKIRNPNDANTVHFGAGMSNDALDYLEAILKREASKV